MLQDQSLKKSKPKNGIVPKAEIRGNIANRTRLWIYSKRAAAQSRHRAKKLKLPHDIDAHYIDVLLVEQQFVCAVSGIPFEASDDQFGGPFGPSLDRIKPELGYVCGNLRVVCQIVNVAMSDWGLEALERLVARMAMRNHHRLEEMLR